jgi:hypothetical protein
MAVIELEATGQSEPWMYFGSVLRARVAPRAALIELQIASVTASVTASFRPEER